MIYGSVCSGIEAATAAWHELGWKPAWFSEIEKFPSAVLEHHYPHIENRGDMTKFKEWNNGAIDLLVGGTPCQSFSIAGLRKGLADPRGNLMLTYLAIAAKYRPAWLAWENVPGALSSWTGAEPPSDLEEGQQWESTETSDFGCFLAGLEELGYGFAYRILDAQYFGVAQRRRRVFVVGHLGDWRSAASVLFERHSLSGDIAPSREAGQAVAALTANGVGTYGADDNEAQAGHLTVQPYKVANCLTARTAKGMNSTLDEGQTPIVVHGTQEPGQGYQAALSVSIRGRADGGTAELSGEVSTALRASNGGGDKPHVLERSLVRRLTPRECERLQGFPDDYTLIPSYAKGSNKEDAEEVARWIMKSNPGMTIQQALEWAGHPDGPRYKALGNSMAVPVMRWIGERIKMVEGISA